MLKAFYDLALRSATTRKLARQLRGNLYRLLKVAEPYREIVTLARLADITSFLDIGAHEGTTVQRFREAGITCPIVGFDPLEENLEVARQNLAGVPDLHWEQAALFDSETERDFYVNANVQTSSLLPNAEGNLESLPDDSRLKEKLTIRTMTLDGWAERQGSSLDLSRLIVKCDTQGAEAAVIRGGNRLFRENVIAFYGEVQLRSMYEGQASFEELNRLLEQEHGFYLHNLYTCLHDCKGRALQTDALWVKQPWLEKLTNR